VVLESVVHHSWLAIVVRRVLNVSVKRGDEYFKINVAKKQK
jgi:hypothetical protein